MWWKRVSRGGVALAAVLFVECVSSTAHAYCRSRTCSLGKTEDQANEQCKHAEDGCISEGKALHWTSPCLRYAVQLDGSPLRGLDADQVAELVEQAFALWKTAECPGGGNPRFEAGFQGFVSCHEHETVCAGASGNVSVVMFHDEVWPYASNALGITTPAAGLDTGVINDADIELNAQVLFDSTDVFPVLAHEVGHFLGLTHSNVEGALMSRYDMSIGLSGELLTADDIAGICDIYPPSEKALSCTPLDPARDACENPEPLEECRIGVVRYTTEGCTVSHSGKGRSATPLAALATLVFVWLSRRRARR